MGYEVAAGLGVRLAIGAHSGEVYVLVGDGSYLMLHSELLTAIQEQLKITILIFDNHGYQCIKNLQIAHGSHGFGNEFRARNPQGGKLDGDYLPINFCQYAEALGAKSFYVDSYETLINNHARKSQIRNKILCRGSVRRSQQHESRICELVEGPCGRSIECR